jgi:phage major head subunit gpT-like protein
MLVNKAVIQEIFKNLKTTYAKAFDAAPVVWPQIAMRVPSMGASNVYAWMDGFPRLKKWVGDKALKSLKAHAYTLENDDFEATVAVLRKHIEDDQLGIYGPMSEMAGFSSKQFPDEGVLEIVSGGFSNACYDGKNFFATDHPVINPATGKPVNVSNKGTMALKCDTVTNARTSYGAARTAMKKFKNDEGQPLNITPNILLVGPALEDTANILTISDRIGEEPNPYKGTAKVVVDSRLVTDTEWCLLDTTKPVKPFVYQDRKPPEFVSQVNLDSDDLFMRGEYKFGTEARAAFGYGFWQLAYGSTGAS